MKNKVEIFFTAKLYHFFRNRLRKFQQQKKYQKWQKNGCPVPPPHIVKQRTIREYQKKYNCSVLIETGTYKGDMIEAQKNIFKKIYSVELSRQLHEKAKVRFAYDKHVRLLQGDSSVVLSKIVEEIEEPALFWLDGHYSGGITAKGDTECPVFDELKAIFNGKELNHVLLIDDAREFTGKSDYPTIDEVTQFINGKNKNYRVEVKDDIIRYTV